MSDTTTQAPSEIDAVRAAYTGYLTAASDLAAAVRGRAEAEAAEKAAREQADQSAQALAAAIHATQTGKRVGDKYHALVGGHLFLVHAYPCHKDSSKVRFYLERQDVARID